MYQSFYCIFYLKWFCTWSERRDAGLIHKPEMLLKQICYYCICIVVLYISPLCDQFLLRNSASTFKVLSRNVLIYVIGQICDSCDEIKVFLVMNIKKIVNRFLWNIAKHLPGSTLSHFQDCIVSCCRRQMFIFTLNLTSHIWAPCGSLKSRVSKVWQSNYHFSCGGSSNYIIHRTELQFNSHSV